MTTYFAHITDQCRADAQKYNVLSEVQGLARKVEQQQSIDNLDTFGKRFVKKNLGRRFRLLIGKQYNEQGDCLLVFWRVYLKSSSEYTRFTSSYEELLPDFEAYCRSLDLPMIWAQKQRSLDPALLPPELSKAEKRFLFFSSGAQDSYSDWVILESGKWITRVRGDDSHEDFSSYLSVLHDVVLEAVEQESIPACCSNGGNIGILCRKTPEFKTLFLIAPIRMGDTEDIQRLKAEYHDVLVTNSQEVLWRRSYRSYPDIVLYDDELWIERVQKRDEKANLALSAEEAEILQKCQHIGYYPLFINGRPGSGKSTVLQYLFAEHLYDYVEFEDELDAPPIYLTYSPELLNIARTNVRNILRSNAKKIIDNPLPEDHIDSLVNQSFECLHDYLLGLLPEEQRFPRSIHIQFPDFRRWYEKTFARDRHLRAISAEMAWHVIRTYIKGMLADEGEYLDLDDFNELPRGNRSVTRETFNLVVDRIWRRYQEWCNDNGFWDDQDLVRKLLQLNWQGDLVLPTRSVVFCDEAQDFTRNELRLIFRLSLYSHRKLQADYLERIPFAFAGDPFQTLNPTGFDWDAIKGNFYEIIRDQLDRRREPKLEIHFEELSFNYRSHKDIVQLCNFVHLIRGVALGKPYLEPQETWFDEAANMPVYFDVESPVFQTQVRSQKEAVIILPCQEGEERIFVENDPFLKTFAVKNDGQITRNIFSPMQAKGLEYRRVVLYKFGQACVDEYPQLLSLMDPAKQIEKLTEDEALPLAYFINRLYVAASRARNRLIVADTREGLDRFWRRYFENSALDDFIEKYRPLWRRMDKPFPWTADHLVKIQPGKQEDWVHDRDDPAELAKDFERRGRSTRDSYILQRAADNYRLAGLEDSALRCDAYRYEFDGEFVEAADHWVKLGKQDRAKDLYWKARAYLQLSNIRDGSLEQRAAQFMAEPNEASIEYIKRLLSDIEQSLEGGLTRADEVWGDIIEELHRDLLDRTTEQDLLPFEWQSLWQQATKYERMGLLKRQAELQQLEVRATPYPEKLEILQRVRAGAERIAASYRQYKGTALKAPQVEIVLHALSSMSADDELETLVNQYPSVEHYAYLVAYYVQRAQTTADEEQKAAFESRLHRWAERLLESWVQEGAWDQAIDFVKGKRLDLPLPRMAENVRKYNWTRYSLDVPFIRLLSVSDVLARANASEQNQVSRYLRDTLLQDPGTFSSRLTVQQAGGAIERAGMVKDCLEFYEMVFQYKTWPANEEDQLFARARWLVCKVRQIDITGDEDRRRSIRREIRMREREWEVNVSDLPKFPEVDLEAQPKPVSLKQPPSRVFSPEGPAEEPTQIRKQSLDALPPKRHRTLPLDEVVGMKGPQVDLPPVSKADVETTSRGQSKPKVKIHFEAGERRFTCQLDRTRGKMTLQMEGEMEMITLSAKGLTAQGSDDDFSEQIETIKHFPARAEYYIAPWNLVCVLRTLRQRRRVVYVDLYLGRKEFELLSLRLAE